MKLCWLPTIFHLWNLSPVESLWPDAPGGGEKCERRSLTVVCTDWYSLSIRENWFPAHKHRIHHYPDTAIHYTTTFVWSFVYNENWESNWEKSNKYLFLFVLWHRPAFSQTNTSLGWGRWKSFQLFVLKRVWLWVCLVQFVGMSPRAPDM